VLINKAYIVPSILGGHILQDSTNMGNIFNSATVYTSTVSINENTSSLIPYFKFALVTNIMFSEFTALYASAENKNIFLNSTYFKCLLKNHTDHIVANAYKNLSYPIKSAV
jgi:hypothetical protein